MTGNSKVTFNEFVIGISPKSKSVRFEDPPKIVTYSPRKEAVSETQPPKFDETIYRHSKSISGEQKKVKSKS